MKIKKKQPVRGEVYLCQFDPARGSEQAGFYQNNLVAKYTQPVVN